MASGACGDYFIENPIDHLNGLQARDAKYFNVKMGPEVTMKMQERAYTSPIWYTPPK